MSAKELNEDVKTLGDGIGTSGLSKDDKGKAGGHFDKAKDAIEKALKAASQAETAGAKAGKADKKTAGDAWDKARDEWAKAYGALKNLQGLAEKDEALNQKVLQVWWFMLLYWTKVSIIDPVTKQPKKNNQGKFTGEGVGWDEGWGKINLHLPTGDKPDDHQSFLKRDDADKEDAGKTVKAINGRLAQCLKPSHKDAEALRKLFVKPNY